MRSQWIENRPSGAAQGEPALVDVGTLLSRCRAGDELAWETLVRTYQSSVYAVTRHYLRDPEEARDVAQDVFIRLYERLDSYSGGDRFSAWLLQMARNASIDRLRRVKARPPASDVSVDDAMLTCTDNPEQNAAAEARERLLRRAVGMMGENNREVLLLKEIHGLKIEEVAQLLGLPVGTVKSRSSRGRLELAVALLSLDPSLRTGTN
jgi:RNA polymerase sigma-70 factor (ECF subfamily)